MSVVIIIEANKNTHKQALDRVRRRWSVMLTVGN